MRWLDRVLQRWRFQRARPWIPTGCRLLDIGCHQGEFLQFLGKRLHYGIGVDPRACPQETFRFRVLAQPFTVLADWPAGAFEVIVLLATVEHISEKYLLAHECYRLLQLGGRLIVTVPSPIVDYLLHFLGLCRLVDGMALEEHHHYPPQAVRRLFSTAGFLLEHYSSFQLGMNHLFVFRKVAVKR
jgi:SAM-dependent methyltransferase